MKFIFVDAENTGLKVIENMSSNIVDKVFVFSKSDCIKLASAKKLYTCLYDYPDGSNQADFLIVGLLSRVLTSLESSLLKNISVDLYSNDKNLILAFEFQCEQFGAKCNIVQTRNNEKLVEKTNDCPSEIIYKNLKQPNQIALIQKKFDLTQQQMSKAMKQLMAENKIKRAPHNKKLWMQS